jgi:membrane protein
VILPRQLHILLVRSVKEFYRDGCTQLAAAISYYVLLSVFPLLIFSAGTLGLFLTDSRLQQELVDAVMDYLPLDEGEGRDDVADAIKDMAGTTGGAVGLFGLMVMTWSASSMFGAVRDSLGRVFAVDYAKPWFRQKLLDLAMVLAFAPFFLASIAATAALHFAQKTSQDVPLLGNTAHSFGAGWFVASTVLPLAISFVAFFVLYWLVPARRLSPRQIWPGALIAAVIFDGSKLAFTIYLENFNSYDVVFGALGTLAAFVFWVYLSANVMLFGAEVVSELPAVTEGRRLGSEPGKQETAHSFRRRAWLLLRTLFLENRGDEQIRH